MCCVLDKKCWDLMKPKRLLRSKAVAATSIMALAASSSRQCTVAALVAPELSGEAPKNGIKKRKTRKKAKLLQQQVPRTRSFGAVSPDLFDDLRNVVRPHTLILGTHPSVTSLKEQQNFAHPVNAFWWIAGDCLGFRRDTGRSKSSGKLYSLAEDLLHEGPILSYAEQQRRLVEAGYCLWDVVASCRRPGSLDQDITEEVANPIQDFCCRQYPTIRRLVMANGASTSISLLRKHFPNWFIGQSCLEDGTPLLQPYTGDGPQPWHKWFPTAMDGATTVTVVTARSVSPAAATFKYAEKRDWWEEHVYGPGRVMHRELNQRKAPVDSTNALDD